MPLVQPRTSRGKYYFTSSLGLSKAQQWQNQFRDFVVPSEAPRPASIFPLLAGEFAHRQIVAAFLGSDRLPLMLDEIAKQGDHRGDLDARGNFFMINNFPYR
jgi:hypothetical protein